MWRDLIFNEELNFDILPLGKSLIVLIYALFFVTALLMKVKL